MKLYNIFYIDYPDYTPKYECTTDNPQKWLEKHNKDRVAEGELVEKADEFDVKEITPIIFNNKEK
tara:strand:- start:1097 stop:1291 length:195 start_codon:yes stop_codon:yes gene_type:complete